MTSERTTFHDPTNRIEAFRRYKPEEFTPAQLRFIQGLVDGKSLDEIARDFGTKVTSIQHYQNLIAEKMGEESQDRRGMGNGHKISKRIHRGLVLAVVKAADEGLVNIDHLSGDVTFKPTPDEVDVWRRLMDGEAPQFMARDLDGRIDVTSVVGELFEKLGVQNEFQAVVVGWKLAKRVEEERLNKDGQNTTVGDL